MAEETSVKEELNNHEQGGNEQSADEQAAAGPENGKLSDQPDQQADAENMAAKYLEERDKFLRLYSDFENFRKQKRKETTELLKTASSSVISQLLPVLDDFDRAINSNESIADPETLRVGFKLIHQKLKQTLEMQGLKEIEAEGADFDTEYHEAITNVPAPSDELKGKVIAVAEKGYFLNEKVIRFAKVIVGQ